MQRAESVRTLSNEREKCSATYLQHVGWLQIVEPFELKTALRAFPDLLHILLDELERADAS